MTARQLAQELHKLLKKAQAQPGWYPFEEFAQELTEIDESLESVLRWHLNEAREAKNSRL